jgi:ABC-2 type transport system permease protein
MFLRLLRIELYKIFKRPRTYISFGALTVFIVLIQFALKVNGEEFLKFFLGGQEMELDIPYAKLMTGYFVCFVILNTLLVHVPLLVALVSADQVSGEANLGTLRMLVGKPIGRGQLIITKFIASVIYIIMMLLWMAIVALLGSMIIFGVNDMYVPRAFDISIIPQADVIWRYILAFLFAALALSSIAALAIWLSVMADNSLGPIVATVCIVIVCTIIQSLEVPVFNKYITPYLFTTHMLGWKGVFNIQANEAGDDVIYGSIEKVQYIYKSILVLVIYIVVFISMAIITFKRKDVLS